MSIQSLLNFFSEGSKRFNQHIVHTSINAADDVTGAENTKFTDGEWKVSKRQDVEQLRRDVLESNDLKARTDDLFLLRFLIARKLNEKESFKLLKSYYTVRKKYKNVFSNFVPSAVKDVLHSGIFEILPQPDQLGRTVVIGRAYKWDHSKFSATDLLRTLIMVLETTLEEERTLFNGIVLIYDGTGLNWHHCLQLHPSMLYLMQFLLEDTFPARFKEWHNLNMHPLAKALMSLVLPILKPKLRKRVHLHGSSMEDLHKYITRETLPVEYGGLLENYDTSATMKRVLQLEEQFRQHQECWEEN